MNFQRFKLDLEKAEESEIKSQNLLDHWKSKRVLEKCLLSFIDYTKERYKKDLHNPDNHNGVITHTQLEPDILEC